jgi:hypothetical protein
MLSVLRFLPHDFEGYLVLARDIAPVVLGAAIAIVTWMKHRAAQLWPTTQGTIWSTHSPAGAAGRAWTLGCGAYVFLYRQWGVLLRLTRNQGTQ